MTNEDIKSGKRFIEAGENNPVGVNESGLYHDGFVDGANWRINSVWHDASEAPQHSGMLIAICKDGKAVLCGPNNSNWKTAVKIFRIVKWAYIEDIIPNMEDKA